MSVICPITQGVLSRTAGLAGQTDAVFLSWVQRKERSGLQTAQSGLDLSSEPCQNGPAAGRPNAKIQFRIWMGILTGGQMPADDLPDRPVTDERT